MSSVASRITFSPDAQQRFLYVLDRRHQRILILIRKSLEIVGAFGDGVGDQPGQFYIMHDMATDSKRTSIDGRANCTRASVESANEPRCTSRW